jgi:hypothetical protein
MSLTAYIVELEREKARQRTYDGFLSISGEQLRGGCQADRPIRGGSFDH